MVLKKSLLRIHHIDIVMIFSRFYARRTTYLTFLLLCLIFPFALLLAPELDDPPLIPEPDFPQVALVVASVKKDDIRWMRKLFPKWEIYHYVADDPFAEHTVPLNKGREAMQYLTWVFQC